MLSFMQMAAALSGNGTGDDTPCSDDGQANEQSVENGELTNKTSLDGEKVNKDLDDIEREKIYETSDKSEIDQTPTTSANSPENVSDKEQEEIISNSDNETLNDREAEKETDSGKCIETPIVLKGNFLARHIIGEESLSRIGSVDVDENAHVELERLNATASGKSWDDELKEAIQIQDVELEALENINTDKVDNSFLDSDYKVTADNKTNEAIVTELPNINEDVINVETKCVGNTDSESDTENVLEIEFKQEIKNTDTLTMPETREEIDGCMSPSLMFASCRYRWEKTIVTQAPSVVFVTLNKKEIEPIKLEWSESSRCFYSEEVRIPVGSYVGNLVVDGAFYPAEDIIVKHYTFEVDLYLKDDIIEDEAQKTGVAKAEEFVKQKNHQNGSETGSYKDIGTSYTPTRATSYTYSAARSRMEAEPPSPSTSADHPASEGSIHLTNKYEELVRTQMSQTKSALVDSNDSEGEVSNSVKSDYSGLNGRRSPVGDDGIKQYQDGDALQTLDMGLSFKSNEDVSYQKENFNISLVEDDVERWSVQSNTSKASDRLTPQAIIDDVLGNGHNRTPIYSTESPVHSKHSSAHSSARQTPTAADPNEPSRPDSVTSVSSASSLSRRMTDPREPVRPESVSSVNSANSATRHVLSDLIDNALDTREASPKMASRESSRSGSVRHTPPAEQISDVLNPADRHSPIRREYLTGSPNIANSSGRNSAQSSANSSQRQTPTSGSQRHTPQKELISGSLRDSHEKLYSPQDIQRQTSQNSSQRQTPQKDILSDSLRASHEKLYSPLDIRTNGGALFGSHNGSSAGSRPQSLTSEQELTQYYENKSETRGTPVIGEGLGSKTGSASSLPAIGTSPRYGAEKRSMTPDNHIRVPASGTIGSVTKGSLLPSRTPPRTPVSTPASNASSRTVTPVNVSDAQEMRENEQIKDLQSTVSNLRQLLATRNQEVVELKGQFDEIKDINRKLQGDLDRHRARASPGPQIAELERKYREALDDREKMNSEVCRLTEELKRKDEPGLNSFNPNSPSALQRQIDDLTSQIQDLHEANEASVGEITAAEKKVKELAGENETLRITQADRQRDILDENRHLKSEVMRLQESHLSHSDATDYRLKIELQQIKDDNRNLRERNYQLHDDNIRLKEELHDLRKSLEMVDSTRKSLRDERRISKNLDAYDRTEKEKSLEPSYHSDHGSHDYRLSDKDTTSYGDTYKTAYSRATYETKLKYKTVDDAVRYDARTDGPRTDDVRHDRRTDGVGYDTLTDVVRDEKDYDTDRFIKSEASRYESYRSVPDGGSSEKPTRPLPHYDQRPSTPERVAKKDYTTLTRQKNESYERNDLDRGHRNDLVRGRRERSRTSSADVDFRSMPLYAADLSKTPSLSGRSKAIYTEISDLRSRTRSKSSGSMYRQYCESDENYPESHERNPTNNFSVSSKVFKNRYVPQNKGNPGNFDDGMRLGAERIADLYARTTSPLNTPPSTHTTRSAPPATLSRHVVSDREDKGYELRASNVYQDDGEMSDTATDILVNAQPLDKVAASTWNRGRHRRGSVGSDGSDSSFSDIDEQLTASVRKRSKSADSREILRRMAPTGSTTVKGDRTLSRTMSPVPQAGLRTVTPRPIATQHNKTTLSLSSSGSLTHGLRPFAPRSPGDLQVNDVIKFSRQGGKLSQGTIKFIGHLPGRGDIYLGVELDKEDGKHDGVFEGIRYFKCKSNKGVFVAYNKVVMAWTSY